MDRATEERLLEFCAGQASAFDEAAWLRLPHELGIEADIVASVAWLLSSNPRFGHSGELQVVAKRLGDRDPLALLRSGLLDSARFSNMLAFMLRQPRSPVE